MDEKKYYVYILECRDKSWYTGITTEIERRMKEHNSGKGAKYTRVRLPTKLVHFWEIDGRKMASKLEYFIKSLTKKKKLRLVESPNLLLEWYEAKKK